MEKKSEEAHTASEFVADVDSILCTMGWNFLKPADLYIVWWEYVQGKLSGMSVASIEQQVRKVSLETIQILNEDECWSATDLSFWCQVGALMVQFPPLNPPPQASASALADQVTLLFYLYDGQCQTGKFLLSNIFILFRTQTTAQSAWKRCLNTTRSGSTPVDIDSTTIASMSEFEIDDLLIYISVDANINQMYGCDCERLRWIYNANFEEYLLYYLIHLSRSGCTLTVEPGTPAPCAGFTSLG